MISLRDTLIAIGSAIVAAIGTYTFTPKGTFHYSLHSPENLARLARGRKIRHQQQRAMTADKRAEKRAKLVQRIKRLS